MSDWTQPICAACWIERGPNRDPVSVTDGSLDPEVCCYCGKLTNSGIYIRVDPDTVAIRTHEGGGTTHQPANCAHCQRWYAEDDMLPTRQVPPRVLG